MLICTSQYICESQLNHSGESDHIWSEDFYFPSGGRGLGVRGLARTKIEKKLSMGEGQNYRRRRAKSTNGYPWRIVEKQAEIMEENYVLYLFIKSDFGVWADK